MRKTTEEQLKESEWERGLYCPNCMEVVPAVDSGFPGLFPVKFLWALFGIDPNIYICSQCGHEFDPFMRK